MATKKTAKAASKPKAPSTKSKPKAKPAATSAKAPAKPAVKKAVAAPEAKAPAKAKAAPAKKTPVAKKPAATASARKPAPPAKKTVAKAAPAKKPAAAKSVKKPAAEAKPAAKAAPVKKATLSAKTAVGNLRAAVGQSGVKKGGKLSASDKTALRKALEALRERVMSEIEFLKDDSLNRSLRDTAGDMSMHGMHMADHGTDNFDREFALNLVSAEHDVLYEIDDALRRLEAGSYGECEECGCMIQLARLEALPFARMCITCKSEREKGATKYRPLGPTLSSR